MLEVEGKELDVVRLANLLELCWSWSHSGVTLGIRCSKTFVQSLGGMMCVDATVLLVNFNICEGDGSKAWRDATGRSLPDTTQSHVVLLISRCS